NYVVSRALSISLFTTPFLGGILCFMCLSGAISELKAQEPPRSSSAAPVDIPSVNGSLIDLTGVGNNYEKPINCNDGCECNTDSDIVGQDSFFGWSWAVCADYCKTPAICPPFSSPEVHIQSPLGKPQTIGCAPLGRCHIKCKSMLDCPLFAWCVLLSIQSISEYLCMFPL
ncbi:hypothetical protein FOZ62_025009, partial [Perkinsus olseni]